MSKLIKQLNVEAWTVDHVCDWLRGVRSVDETYLNFFKLRNINGKKLSVLEFRDVCELIPDCLSHQLLIFKSIQNLLQLKHDIQNENLQSLIFKTHNRLKGLITYLNKIHSCIKPECDLCFKLKQDFIKQISSFATSYRKLITWLIKIPFTKLKKFEKFRDDVNYKAKNLLKYYRKKLNENQFEDLKQILTDLLAHFESILTFCETNCEKENGKISIAFNYSYLEKVNLKKNFNEQELGLSLISLVEGVYTIAEIGRGSSADECSRLNVEDDILAVNNQFVIGWDVSMLNKLLKESFDSFSTVSLLLRKMPKDHMITLKQQQANQQNLVKKHGTESQKTHQRKHSFSNVFLTDEYLLDNSSDEEETEEEKEVDLNNNELKNQSDEILNKDEKKQELFEKNTKNSKSGKKSFSKLAKSKAKNRLIRSMQNLLSYDRSRSNSADNLSIESKKSDDERSPKKSDLLKSIFLNKKWEILSKKSNQNLYESESSDTPNLINIKRIDSSKKLIEDTSETQKVSSKPPLNKRAYKISQKPTIQGWLFKQKISCLSSSLTNLNSPVKHQINNRGTKWKHYWCVLVKDYIAFYKYPDDKTPKDFLLLKDFSINKSENKKNGFILYDKIKQIEHEFYSESSDEFKEWFQCLTDLNTKNELQSQSNTSLSSASGYDSLKHSESVSNLQTQSLPTSTNLNRKNHNLQLNLSTILDSSDDLNLTINSSPPASAKNSPTLISNLNNSYNSSRESSPGLSNKPSRDSSPSLIYPYMQDNLEPESSMLQTTSESDAESKLADNNSKKSTSRLNSRRSSAVNASISAQASAGLIKSSCSPSPSSTNQQGSHFVYDDQSKNTNETETQSRANSLPGSLQYCVGSLVTPNLNNTQNQKNQQINQTKTINSPKSTQNNFSSPNSPLLSKPPVSNLPLDASDKQKYYVYVQNQSKLPKTRKISVQVGANGITQINTFNAPSNQVATQQQNQQFLIKTNPGINIRKPTISNQSNPVVYRTEITILPSSSNSSSNNANTNISSNSTANLVQPQNVHHSTSLPKYLSNNPNPNKDKIIRF